MDAYRQAAMCLHGLEDADRDWLLNRLPEEQSAILSELLSELKALGIPREKDLVRGLLPDLRERADRNASRADFTELERSSPEAVWLQLQNEPESVIRAVVMGRDWAWRGYVLKQYRKKHGRNLTTGQSVGAKTFEALVSIVAERVRANGGLVYRQPGAAWHQRLRKRLWPR